MPVRTGVPRSTHQWLDPLYDALDNSLGYIVPSGASGIANATWLGRGVAQTQVGNATGVVGFYGVTGIASIATGTAGTTGSTGMGGNTGPEAWWFNGGSGAYYKIGDIVLQLKNLGLLPR